MRPRRQGPADLWYVGLPHAGAELHASAEDDVLELAGLAEVLGPG